jgi:UPF0755 protein
VTDQLRGPHVADRSTDEVHDDDHPLFGAGPVSYEPVERSFAGRPLATRHQHRRRRRRRISQAIAVLAIAAVIAVSWVLVKGVAERFHVADYSGSGQGFVRIQIQSGDSADDIAGTLVKKGVVQSTRAFINAAKKSGQSADIQPGVYQVRLHSSGAAAMAAILDPANRLISRVTIPEGYTYLQVLQAVADKTKLPLDQLKAAAKDVANLGIPDGVTATSAEGMLFPATYAFDPNTTPSSALQAMITKFGSEYVSLNMAAKAKALNLTPYQVLIIASITEAEAKFDADRAKVARVIMNRIAQRRALQVDATSAYGGKLQGKDPAKVVYATFPGPFNTYTHLGLPPTPIGNPGEKAISAALSPPAGPWLWYVNIDAAGHLGFFRDEAAFTAASNLCAARHWGCGGG